MENLKRRDFVKKALVTSAAFTVVPRHVMVGYGQVVQPSDKIRVALIGLGSRMNQHYDMSFVNQPDVSIVALCDVDANKLKNFKEKRSLEVDTYGDYRRILDRKDIDAVVVSTPDHWHSPMTVDACDAGKDVYLEKPISHTVPDAVKIMEATQKKKRIVQIGTQQRSWPYFQECVKAIQDGKIGTVQQVIVQQGAGGARNVQQSTGPEQIPEGLDWDMWQGPAPRHPFSSARLRWRNYYDYGGGSVTDWGVHHIDIVLMALGNLKFPKITSAVSIPNADPELVPTTYSINYDYGDFLMTFMTCVVPTASSGGGMMSGGPGFFGDLGYATVNRSGYLITPTPSRGNQPPPFEAIDSMKGYSNDQEGAALAAHHRNWLDCIKSREKPICDAADVGFYASLPCLIGVQAIKEGRALSWDPKTKTVKSV